MDGPAKSSRGTVAKSRIVMRFTRSMVLATLVALAAGCVDPESPRVRFVYRGSRTGRVWVTQRVPTTGGDGSIPELVVSAGATIERMREVWTGEPDRVSAGAEPRIWARSHLERGAVVKGWIDVDGDDADRCRPAAASERVRPDSPLLASCVPEAGDPMGKIAALPFAAVIPLELRDPEDPQYAGVP